MSRWSHYESALQEVREQQTEDFRLVMVALATTRDAVTSGLERVQAGLERHQHHNQRRLELLEQAARAEAEEVSLRLDCIEERLDRLEPPAA